MKQSSRLCNVLTSLIALALIGLSAVVVLNRDFVYDTWRAYQFTPTVEISLMPDATGMNDRGRLLFYAHHPTLEGTQKFNSVCLNTEKNSMVIGCYNGRSIYIFDVDNDEIEGIEEVTAAHEMLHAAYDRLSNAEKNRIDSKIRSLAVTLKDSPELKERMKSYQSLAENDQLNELHSIFGTEVRDLPADLEEYYGRYFSDRLKTVALYEQYAEVFKELQDESSRLAASLDSLADQINRRTEGYNVAARQLSSDINDFNRRASAGHFSSQYAFQYERSVLVQRSSLLDAEYAAIQQMIHDYNEQKAQYDQVAQHLSELTNSLDSSLAPPPEVQ